MRVFTIARKELQGFFFSPVAYVVWALFLLLNGMFFIDLCKWLTQSPLDSIGIPKWFLWPLMLLFIFLPALLTMRLFAEERRSGTIESLLTCPVRDGEVVVGKFLGAFAFLAMMVASLLIYFALIRYYAHPDPKATFLARVFGPSIPAMGPIWSGIVGTLLFGGFLLALGIFFSALTKNQITAALPTALVGLGMFFIVGLWQPDWDLTLWGKPLRIPEIVKNLCPYADPQQDRSGQILQAGSYVEFLNGIVDARHVLFYLTTTGLLLYLTTQAVASKKWK